MAFSAIPASMMMFFSRSSYWKSKEKKRIKIRTSSKRSASLADSTSETKAGGGGPISTSLSSPMSASLKKYKI
jgi:hypothetical protein